MLRSQHPALPEILPIRGRKGGVRLPNGRMLFDFLDKSISYDQSVVQSAFTVSDDSPHLFETSIYAGRVLARHNIEGFDER
jgi:hypothetical protein